MTFRLHTWLSAIVLVGLFGLATVSKIQAADPHPPVSAASKAVREKIDLKAPDGCRHIYGFNYQPSWGYNGLTVWGEKFNAQKYREELACGKKCFPKFNTVRIWLSWSAYRANPDRFLRNFQQAIEICGEQELLVVPVIFNRWMGNPLWDRVVNPEIAADFDATFAPFVRALVTPRKGDLRILAWDLCNEPFLQGGDSKQATVSTEMEVQWLGRIRDAVKQCDSGALVCIGVCPVLEHLTRTASLQDILTPHLYTPMPKIHPKSVRVKLEEPSRYAGLTKACLELAKKLEKPLVSTECCWGSEDDEERVQIVRINLQILKEHKIGFFPHALWTSGVADLHSYADGKGLNMPFILEDGSLRPGHEVYNEFAQ